MGEAADKSDFMRRPNASDLKNRKVKVKGPAQPKMPEAKVPVPDQVEAFVPEGSSPVALSPAASLDSREMPVPDKAIEGKFTKSEAAFVPDYALSVSLKEGHPSKKDLGKKLPVSPQMSVPASRISSSGVFGSKPLPIQQRVDAPDRNAPLHLVGGSQKPPTPPKASATAPEMPEEPARSVGKDAALEARQKLTDIKKRIQEFVASAGQKSSSGSEKDAGKDSELQEENRVLLNIVARLKEENDRLRKAVNAS